MPAFSTLTTVHAPTPSALTKPPMVIKATLPSQLTLTVSSLSPGKVMVVVTGMASMQDGIMLTDPPKPPSSALTR